MSEINGVKVPFIPIVKNNDYEPGKVKNNKENFDAIFKEELAKVKFSNHALKRLESRNISLNDNELDKIQNAVQRAEEKGAKDSLVMMRDKAFIVNIPNRTVITAMQVGEEQDNVFTNIDSVVFT